MLAGSQQEIMKMLRVIQMLEQEAGWSLGFDQMLVSGWHQMLDQLQELKTQSQIQMKWRNLEKQKSKLSSATVPVVKNLSVLKRAQCKERFCFLQLFFKRSEDTVVKISTCSFFSYVDFHL